MLSGADDPNSSHLDQAIDVGTRLVELVGTEHPDAAIHHSNLAASYRRRHQHSGNRLDLAAAITSARHAASIAPFRDGAQFQAFHNLGLFCLDMFDITQDTKDLEEALHARWSAIKALPAGHPAILQYLIENVSIIDSNASHLPDFSNLDTPVDILQTALVVIADDHPRIEEHVRDLATTLYIRYGRSRDSIDLDVAIETQREAIVLIGHDSVLAVGYASNLSLLMMLAGKLGDGVDVMDLLDAQTAKAENFPDEHEEKPTLLLNVALMHSRAYDTSGDKSHLDAAVTGARRCLEIMSPTHRDRPLMLLHAGSFLMQRFEREGDIADLDTAMELLKESTSRLHPSHPERAEHFVNLAQAHLTRFQRIGQVMDLDVCIDLARRALDISVQRVFKTALLQTLGTALMLRFERLHDLDDLHAAVAALRDSLESLPSTHKDRSIVLFSLSSALGSRFDKLRDTADLDEGIKAIHEAIDILPEGHSMKPLFLSYLGKFLGGLRFNATGDITHLEAGVAAEREALQLIESSHAGRPRHLGDLRCCLQARFQTYQNRNDLELAIQTLKSTFESGILATEPIVQFEAAHACGLLLRRHYSASESMPVFASMIDLVPHIVWLGGKLSQRYADVKGVSGMIDDAISAAIESQNARATLDWLEQSRCIVWSQVQSLHLPGIEQLRAADVTLARDFEQVVHSLQGLATRANTGFGLLGKEASYRDIPVEDEGLIHRTLAARYTQLLGIARTIPGLAGFMYPERFSRRVWTAISGPVVIVHPAQNHCDIVCILPLEPHGPGQTTPNECVYIRLGTFTLKLAHALRRKLLECLRAAGVSARAVVPHSSTRRDDFELVLQKLWISLVKPIVDEIQKTYTFTGRAELPHLTWCLSGPVAFLPLHAAGLYDGKENEQPRAYDLFVSSYTPSLTALLDAHRRHGRRAKEVSPSVLAIAQPDTPGLSRLPGTTREVNILQGIVPVLDRLDGPEATRAAVLEAMKTHHWVHLACHGIQNGEDPTKSALRLHDGALELREMMRASFPNAELAVLSACETATGDDTVPQEAVHLAAGMLMAGFESVVATSWLISDEDGPVLALELYTHLLNEGQGDVTRTAYALHHATKCLRGRVGEKNFVRWLPFIHMGL
ncbi:hypothetical protein PENSPDRAFT_568266 [Peniophora sp. CONT]|nr:hypothetical protein PENSPDRAFT_568266 [Peniophora sp. CONT]